MIARRQTGPIQQPERKPIPWEEVKDELYRRLASIRKELALLKRNLSPENKDDTISRVLELDAQLQSINMILEGVDLPEDMEDIGVVIQKGLVLIPKEHLRDWEDETAIVQDHDEKLGWYIVVGDNFSRWYKDEKDILRDFDIPGITDRIERPES